MLCRTLAAALALAAATGSLAQEIVDRKESHEWTLKVHLVVRGWSERDSRNMPKNDVWNFDTAAVVFPIPDRTSSSRTHDAKIESELTLNDRPGDSKMTIIQQAYHSGIRLGRWELAGKTGSEVELHLSMPVTAYETVYNEEEAKKIPWPSVWPEVALSTFEPMMYIDAGPNQEGQVEPYDMEPIERLLKDMTGGSDPKSIPPATLAKWIAGEMQRRFQMSGNGIAWSRQGGMMEGIDLQGAPLAAKRMRGSEFDMTCVLVALYRRAGLASRLVIGYDAGADSDDDDFLGGRRRSNRESLRSWVEFALVHPQNESEVIWVPVDVVRMREKSSVPAGLDRAWEFFGTHDELDGLIPFAYQFHPPTTVRAYGSPGFWGWLVTPEAPDKAYQTLRFEAITTPKRGGDPEQPGEQPRRGYR